MSSERCTSKIAHGPGHQSISQCELTGKHTIHQATLYPRMFHWTDADVYTDPGVAFTGFFDEDPETN